MCHVLFLRVKDISVPNAGGESESYWYVGSPQNLQQIENFLTPVAISSPVKNISCRHPGPVVSSLIFVPNKIRYFPAHEQGVWHHLAHVCTTSYR